MRPAAARALVFTASAAVLVLEILAGRLLAPWVGVTLETFTAIIGTVLAGIATGGWLGGRAADRWDPRRLVGVLFAAGGSATLAIPPIVDVLGPTLTRDIPAAAVALAGLGFFLPAALLSAVTPAAVKATLTDLRHTGSVVGELSAFATAGALAGTFVTGFFLVAAFGTRQVVAVLGVLLVAVGVVVGLRRREDAALLVVPIALVGIWPAVAAPCHRETVYYCARIVPDPDDPDLRVLWLDTLPHSAIHRDPTEVAFRYGRLVTDVVDVELEGPLRATWIGGGGFGLPRWLDATRPGSRSVVLEVDEGLVDLAVEELGIDVERFAVVVGDARVALRGLPPRWADLVVGDAFGGLAVPWHLTTVEFLEDVSRHLDADGVYVLNLIDYPPNGFARAEAATLLEVFDHVALLAPPDFLEGRAGGNFVFVAANRPLRLDPLAARLRARGAASVVVSGEALEAWVGATRPLVDDRAPVDQLLTPPPRLPPRGRGEPG